MFIKFKKKKWLFASLLILAVIIYNLPWAGNYIKIKSHAAPICIKLYCEPQIIPDCKNSLIKLQPCQQISKHFWSWINSHGFNAIRKAFRAAGHNEIITSATIYCNKGIYNKKRILGKRWSQHSFRRACDGNRIKVNNIIFKYRGYGVQRPKNKHDRFFVTFLDNWGTIGFGVNVRSTFALIDFNRGVRDCREDTRHCAHYHISKPCYSCIVTGAMGYE